MDAGWVELELVINIIIRWQLKEGSSDWGSIIMDYGTNRERGYFFAGNAKSYMNGKILWESP